MGKTVKVLIVDDQALIRQLLTAILSKDDEIDIVGSAIDPIDARDKIKALNPDVITLDVEMPRMDGITFLRNLMRLRPMPVVMISTLTEKGAAITLEALEIGAIDFIPKPKVDVPEQLAELSADIILKVKQAAWANIAAIEHNAKQQQFPGRIKSVPKGEPNAVDIIAIGASTGGTEAIKEVLRTLPDTMPPIVIVQHMPPGFTTSFAERLDSLLDLTVEEFTKSGQALKRSHIYLANGSQHMLVKRRGGNLYGYCDDSAAVNRHKPSVDMLFESVAKHCGEKSIGIILTGMGSDGANGLGQMRQQGGFTIAQDESTSIVWGMPRMAIEKEAASEVLALGEIGGFLVNRCYGK
ncbi:MAG: chemotaxis response regulator protein-glutamate methylesterase [Pseudomonadales bacterium]